MPHAFSNALYYPTIDILNTNWLKTAILFWDSISTIVPESLNQPYEQLDTQYLADIGFLRPLYVNSDNKSVIAIEDDIINLMHSPEFLQVFCNSQRNNYSGIWKGKISRRVIDNLKQLSINGIYGEKMSERIRNELRHISNHLNDTEIFYLDEQFSYIYMIVLASKLCDDHSLGMITDNIPCFTIGNAARLGNQTTTRPEDRFRNRRPREHQMEQGLLLDYIIKGLSISPDTTFADIVAFKSHHRDELGRFKIQLANLTANFAVDEPIDILQQKISDVYNNEFKPAYNALKAALKSSRIKSFTESFLKISLLSTSTTSVSTTLLGMPLEQSIVAGIGVSVIASAISYNADKKKSLQENPYSYLLSINREWT